MSVLHLVPLWRGGPAAAEVLRTPVTTLAGAEVFVFGSNEGGFHGAGSAGLVSTRGRRLFAIPANSTSAERCAASAASPSR